LLVFGVQVPEVKSSIKVLAVVKVVVADVRVTVISTNVDVAGTVNLYQTSYWLAQEVPPGFDVVAWYKSPAVPE
jgi:hypothetical protein